MGISFEMHGFDELNKKLENLQENANKIDGAKVSFGELFNESFMREHTEYSSLDEFVKSGGYSTDKDEFEKIPDDEFDQFVRSKTNFDSWEDMQRQALRAYTLGKLGL